MIGLVKQLLAHPATRGLDLDDPRLTELRRRIIRRNPFLLRIYRQWYGFIADSLPAVSGPVLEIGSGGGFLDEHIPGLITSDLLAVSGVKLALDAHRLPLADRSLRAIAMVNVAHHLADLKRFFRETQRCLKPGGRLIMVEPWVTWWSKQIYRRLHHEPLDLHTPDWAFPQTGPLSAANVALPWIALGRDRAAFEREFPLLAIRLVRPTMPLCYLVSGGVSMRPLMPGWAFGLWHGLEQCLQPWINTWAMFAQIVVERTDRAL
jgi:SAM-dependent methyltransferase